MRQVGPYLLRVRRVINVRQSCLKAIEVQRKVFSVSAYCKSDDWTHDIEVSKRQNELRNAGSVAYPRTYFEPNRVSCQQFREKFNYLKSDETSKDGIVVIQGRVTSSRVSGSKLVFLDIAQDGISIQGLCNQRVMTDSGCSEESFREFSRLVRRGDHYMVRGLPHRSKRGQLSVMATELPTLLSPALRAIPLELSDPETRIRHRHIDLLVNKKQAEFLRLRSHIIQFLRSFFQNDQFLEVETPILSSQSNGAIATPFTTVATEFQNRRLSLRIAPEIWLKRLIIGGMDRIFEIGPSFRNEGLDATHNPEFTTCEFYRTYTSLEELIWITESLFQGLADNVSQLRRESLQTLPAMPYDFNSPWKRVSFIPEIEKAIGRPLPLLHDPGAVKDLKSIFTELSIPLPNTPTLPRLIDALCSKTIESKLVEPTFIMYHPEALSPLSKSFEDPETGQRVAARVELFVNGSELVNAYEEENDPEVQREKFVSQLRWKLQDERPGNVVESRGSKGTKLAYSDEDYIRALQCSLPPTGGWGCGIDRLCMLFSGASRIGSVKTFGSLSNVVKLGGDSGKC